MQLISYCFPPMMAGAAYATAKLAYQIACISDMGVRVMCPDLAMFGSRDNSFDDLIESCEIERVSWRGQRLFELFNHRTRLYFDDYALFPIACRKRMGRSAKADVYIIRGQFFSSFSLAKYVRYHLGRPVVLYFSDPFVQNPYYRWTATMLRMAKKLEGEALHAATGAIFTTTEAMEMTLGGYPDLSIPCLVAPHSFVRGMYPDKIRRRRRGDKIIFCYSGTFYGRRSPDALFRVIGELIKRNDQCARRIEIWLLGAENREIVKTIHMYGIEEVVRRFPRMAYRECLRVISECDVLLNIDAPFQWSPFLPAKLIDYLGCGLPIWTLSPPGPAAAIVERYGGIVTNPSDSAAIERDLRRCVEMTERSMWKLDRDYAENFACEKLSGTLVEFLREVARIV